LSHDPYGPTAPGKRQDENPIAKPQYSNEPHRRRINRLDGEIKAESNIRTRLRVPQDPLPSPAFERPFLPE